MQDSQPIDAAFMRQALRLARRGLGRSSPNPAVGAVVVREGRVIGRGFHARAGTPHAEVLALKEAGAAARGATIYVTLEPCHHQGRTPPCTQAILEAGIARVVYGAADPNPRVAGGGGAFLSSQGVEVVPGVLAAACAEEHRFFFTHITRGRPHVILKTAATLDGKTAPADRRPGRITGRESLAQVHRLRDWCDAICVGVGTLLSDDPQLTCRRRGGRDPLRVIVDSSLRTPPTARVINPASSAGCLIACGESPDPARRAALEAAGATVAAIPGSSQRVDPAGLLAELGRRGVTSLLLEGGATLAWSLVAADLVDEVVYFLAPKLLGGEGAVPMLGGEGFGDLERARPLERIQVRRMGQDLMLTAKVAR